MVAVRRKGKVKSAKERPLAKGGIVLRDFTVGNHVFKKGTRDSWSQVRLSSGTESLLTTIGVHLDHGYGSIDDTEAVERKQQEEADRQLELLAVQLEREHEEETRKRLERVAAKKRALAKI